MQVSSTAHMSPMCHGMTVEAVPPDRQIPLQASQDGQLPDGRVFREPRRFGSDRNINIEATPFQAEARLQSTALLVRDATRNERRIGIGVFAHHMATSDRFPELSDTKPMAAMRANFIHTGLCNWADDRRANQQTWNEPGVSLQESYHSVRMCPTFNERRASHYMGDCRMWWKIIKSQSSPVWTPSTEKGDDEDS
ncbi:hypothetical protein CNYM01_05809 [Colletotrichum nymphaeae SA-01]|uniref:Uncharacterized protein n=1 Tax=Colletotrichum nymphaeae SA-01 TaxID=1460502 RepID=A0A135UWT9_9PEZI|nr:hypothetical protein CNYM01_05809 [Colletotrichum nymphaeae SA-01]